MLVCKITARKARPSEGDNQRYAFEGLLGAYRLDGHVLGRDLITASLDRQFEAYVLIPAADAFEPRFSSEWIHRDLEKAKLAGLCEPEFSIVGSDLSEPDGCECNNTTTLILFTTYLQLQSPAKCGSCFRPFPLYRLPRFESGEFVEVISWFDDYKACDSLFMNSATGERFGYREMSQVNSSLSRHGRDICKHFEQSSGKPAYYHLHRHYGRSRVLEERRKCPGCGGEWRLAERWHDFFDFRCDRCRLVSTLASQVT
jgi:predicted  nucleic acid-binding Zn ribbon protein